MNTSGSEPFAGEFTFDSDRSHPGFTTGIDSSSRSDSFRSSVTPDGRFTVMLAGTVNNFDEATAKLDPADRPSGGDPHLELVVGSFQKFGVDALDVLDGPFAVAVFDNEANRLFLARDRVGQVPVHHQVHSGRFRFSNNLRELAETTSPRPGLNHDAIEAYLQLTYIPAPLTIHEGILQLEPGTVMWIDTDGAHDQEPYWDLDYSDANQSDDPNLGVRLREALTTAVEESLAQPGRSGTLLSGGIDSTIITGLAATVLDRPVDSFTISFADKRYDESALARLAAEQHWVNHHVIQLEHSDVLDHMDSLMANLDQPYGDSSYLAAHAAARAASQQVDAILTGDAGDELFAGYSKYLIGHYSDLYNKFPNWMANAGTSVANKVLSSGSSLLRKVNKVAESARLETHEQRERLMSLGFSASELNEVLKVEASGNTTRMVMEHYEKFSTNKDELRQALYLDFKMVLEGDMLPKSHYAGRPFRLATRVPMLYRKVTEVAAQIPSNQKISSTNTKIVLKEVFSDLIPKELLSAPKQGFSLPMSSWTRNELRHSVDSTLSEETVADQGLLNPSRVAELKAEHFSSSADNSSQLWSLHVLTNWVSRNA